MSGSSQALLRLDDLNNEAILLRKFGPKGCQINEASLHALHKINNTKII